MKTLHTNAIIAAAAAIQRNIERGEIMPSPFQMDESGCLYPDVDIVTHLGIIANGEELMVKLKEECPDEVILPYPQYFEHLLKDVQNRIEGYSQDGRFDGLLQYPAPWGNIIAEHLKENIVLIAWTNQSYQF